MPVETGDLVKGNEVLIKGNKRHVYVYPDPRDGTRTCAHCDLQETKPWKENDTVVNEKACPGR